MADRFLLTMLNYLLLDERFDCCYRLGLLLLRGDCCWKIPFLGTVVSKLGMVAAFTRHRICRIINILCRQTI